MKAPLALLTALFIASAHQTLLGETSGDWTYSVSDNQATITGYSGAGGAVDIPAVVNEISVVKVGDGWPPIFGDENTTVTSVTIPDSVTSIGDDAFYECTNLASVTIPDSVTSIGDYAFYDCLSLTSITIPDSVTSIGTSAFRSCTSLASITIPESVTSIGYRAFDSCTSLASITIPESVTSIGYSAFRSCANLTSVTIPDSVTSIGSYAFYNCTSLTSITIGNSVTSIGSYAFSSCYSLTSITVDAENSNYSSVDGVLFNKLQTLLVQYPAGILANSYTIPDSVTSIGVSAFFSCTKLASITVDADNSNYSSVDGVLFNKLQTLLVKYPPAIVVNSYTIPNSVTSIGNSAFSSCTNLASVTIPDSVTSIGYSAFESCTKLASVTIPDSVTSIGNYAFYSCTSLTSITIPDSVTSIGDYAFENCARLASVTIPDSVTSIGIYAFSDCYNLTSITIPDSVTSIGYDAFGSCTSLTSVTLPILFIDSYPSFSLSSDQVLLYGSPAARDVPLSNNFTAGRASSARTIVNVSARVTLGSGQMVTPGFVVRDVPTKLLIRAVGPRLGDFGVNYLPNPRMTIFDGSQNVVRTIDDWESDNPVSELSDLMTATASAGAFPLEQDTASAATLVTLDPGVYTVQVDSADEGVGDVLVEVYEISE